MVMGSGETMVTFLPATEVPLDIRIPVQVSAAYAAMRSATSLSGFRFNFTRVPSLSFRHSAAQGVVGLLEDNLQVMRPWGFDVAAITVPVSVWQGAHDRMVPFAHGQWLARTVPGARAHLFDDEGHVSLVHRLDEMFAQLRELARL